MATVTNSMTPEAYLEFERASERKHEYLDGEVTAMVGASLQHVRIVTNLVGLLSTAAREREFEVLATDMRVKVATSGLYTYHDVAVVQGEPVLEDDRSDTLLNPIVLIEVLSPSTEAYDRGRKFEHYRQIESLREYILIAQDRPHIERFRVGENRDWLLSEYSTFESRLPIETLQCEIALGDIYRKVDFAKSERA